MKRIAKKYPKIITEDFELGLDEPDCTLFKKKRDNFISLIEQIIEDLDLTGKIEKLFICPPDRRRAEIYRAPNMPWPSKILFMDIYNDRYLDENLLRHELGHEADRWRPEMKYDPEIENRWQGRWELELAANISLDSRLGDGGLGKEKRKADFLHSVGLDHMDIFEEAWNNPPVTWIEMESLANKFSDLGIGVWS
jgi:hypothetical protein